MQIDMANKVYLVNEMCCRIFPLFFFNHINFENQLIRFITSSHKSKLLKEAIFLSYMLDFSLTLALQIFRFHEKVKAIINCHGH